MEVSEVNSPNAMIENIIQCIMLVHNAKATGESNPYLVEMLADPEKFLEVGRDHALSMMETMKSVRPTFFLYSAAGTGVMIPFMLDGMPENRQARAMIAANLSAIVNLAPMDGYLFMAEMWFATVSGEEMKPGTFRPPSQRDDRKEVVIVHAYFPDKSVLHSYDIIRGADGEVTNLVEDKQTSRDNIAAVNMIFKNLFEPGGDMAKFKDIIDGLVAGDASVKEKVEEMMKATKGSVH
jgi:hypothetical protein